MSRRGNIPFGFQFRVPWNIRHGYNSGHFLNSLTTSTSARCRLEPNSSTRLLTEHRFFFFRIDRRLHRCGTSGCVVARTNDDLDIPVRGHCRRTDGICGGQLQYRPASSVFIHWVLTPAPLTS